MTTKKEFRKIKAEDNKEFSQPMEIRMVGSEGVFEGYLTTWGNIDTYNSTFQRGSFKKTIQERGSKVKVFYDHTHLVGSSMEIIEDDKGVFARGKLNLKVPKAQEAFTFMEDGTLEGLSFGFRTIKEGFSEGVRVIKEVQLFEFGPVVFPASDEALITDVREDRATDFNESLTIELLDEESWTLRNALSRTLSDIWFSSSVDNTQVIGALDKALSDHLAAYLDYAARYLALLTDQGFRHAPGATDLEKRFRDMLTDKKLTVEELAQQTTFTLSELNELRAGNMVDNREQLGSLSVGIEQAHNTKRNEAVETLCSELRGKLTASEKLRISSLLTDVEVKSIDESNDYSDILNYFKTEQSIGEKDNG